MQTPHTTENQDPQLQSFLQDTYNTTMADATATPSNSTPLGQDCLRYDLELVLLENNSPGKADFPTAPDTRTRTGTRTGPGIRGSREIGFTRVALY